MEPKQEIINHALSRGPLWPTQIHSFSAAVEDGAGYSAWQVFFLPQYEEPVFNVRSYSQALIHVPLTDLQRPRSH